MTITILYFVDNASPSPTDLVEIATIEGLSVRLSVRNSTLDSAYGERLEVADFVAGTVPPEYGAYPLYSDGDAGHVIYFLAGTEATPAEIDAITIIDAIKYMVLVRNTRKNTKYNGHLEPSDFVAGNVPADYAGVPVFTLVTVAPTAITIEEPTLPVFDTDVFGASGGGIALTGTMAVTEPNVVLQYRVRNATSGDVLVGWTDFTEARTTEWAVTITRPASKTPMRVDVRGKHDVAVTASQSGKFYAGHVVGWLGQSLAIRPLTHAVVGVLVPPVDQLYVLFNDINGTLSAGPQLVNNAAVLGLRRMAAVVNEYFDAPVLIVDLTESGTGRGAMFDNTDLDRNWDTTVGNPVDYIRSRGSDLSVVLDHWFTNDASSAAEFDRIWAPGYVRRQIGGLGDTADASGVTDYVAGQVDVIGTRTYTPNNHLWDLSAAADGGLFDAARTKWFPMYGAAHWDGTDHADGVIGVGDQQKGDVRKAIADLTSNPAFDAITLSTVAGYAGAEGFAGLLAQPKGTHVATLDVDGEPLCGVYQMIALGRALGYLVRAEPRTVSAVFDADGMYADVTFSLEHGGVLSTAFAEHASGTYAGSFEGDTWVVPTTDPATLEQLKEVQGFSLTQSGVRSFNGFTAVVHNAAAWVVRITPTAPFINGDAIDFGYGDGVHMLNAADVAAARPYTRWPIETRPHISGTGYGWPMVRDSGTTPQIIASGITTVIVPSFTTAGAVPTYFVDPSNLPAGTTKLEFRARLNFPTPLGSGIMIHSQESQGADLTVLSNGKLRVYVEDGTGTSLLIGGIDLIPGAGAMHDYVTVIDMVAGQATFTYDNAAPVVMPFTAAGNGFFMSGRELSFLASTQGSGTLPAGTEVEYVEVYVNDVLHHRVAGDAATVNADSWKRGGDAV